MQAAACLQHQTGCDSLLIAVIFALLFDSCVCTGSNRIACFSLIPPMKVAVFSDVQANYPSLIEGIERILSASPDLVVMNGDLINRGPRSLECLDLFEEMRKNHGWIALRGNHEDFVWQCAQSEATESDPVERDMQRFADWTCRQLGARIRAVESWLESYSFQAPNGGAADVAAMHGSLVSNRTGIQPHTAEEDLEVRVPRDLAVFLTAHTHRPFIRQYGACQIVNSGSVGSPFDGDPRGSYALLEYTGGCWRTEIVRFAYDRTQADRDYHHSGFLEQGGPLARLIYEEWKQAISLMPAWRKTYLKPVAAGDVSLQTAVDTYLSELR